MSTLSSQTTGRRVPKRARPGPGVTSKPIARDDVSRGVLVTEISPALAWVLTVAFLGSIVALPIAQSILELRRHGPIQRSFAVFLTPGADSGESARVWKRANAAVVCSERASSRGFKQRSRAGWASGSANVVLGRDGWLFYGPGIELVTGPGLLDPNRLTLAKRDLIDAGETNPAPDPRPAIRAFLEACNTAGVHLVVLPIPEKAMVQPAELSSRFKRSRPGAMASNVDYARLLSELRSAGVDVFDPSPKLLLPGEPARFLRQDTHWTPEWMEEVARNLAEHLKSRVPSLRVPTRSWWAERREVSRVGDIVDMLKLPEGQSLYQPQTVSVHRVLDPRDGSGWQPSAEGDVLLLGDSFSNIYCTSDLGWGDAAGLPAQLARFLERDVDVIARNGSAATATRRELAASEPQPLAGKTVLDLGICKRLGIDARQLGGRFDANEPLRQFGQSSGQRPGGISRSDCP